MSDLKMLLIATVNYLISKGFAIIDSKEYAKSYFGDSPSKNITDYNSHSLDGGQSIVVWNEMKGKTLHYLCHLGYNGLLMQINLYETFHPVFNVAIKGNKKKIAELLANQKKFNGIEDGNNSPDVEFSTFQRIKANKTGSPNNQLTTKAIKSPDTTSIGDELTGIFGYLAGDKGDNVKLMANKAAKKSKAKTNNKVKA